MNFANTHQKWYLVPQCAIICRITDIGAVQDLCHERRGEKLEVVYLADG